METYPFHDHARGAVRAEAAPLFEHLDDPTRLSRHMQERSMAMMGSSMRIETDALGGRAVGSVIRMTGSVLGVRIGLDEAVTEREPPRRKAWATLGEPRLLVIGPYRMGFAIEPADGGSQLTVFIDYALPASRSGRLLGRLLGRGYARWCCQRMLADAQQAMADAKR
jgi:hypothetical protein